MCVSYYQFQFRLATKWHNVKSTNQLHWSEQHGFGQMSHAMVHGGTKFVFMEKKISLTFSMWQNQALKLILWPIFWNPKVDPKFKVTISIFDQCRSNFCKQVYDYNWSKCSSLSGSNAFWVKNWKWFLNIDVSFSLCKFDFYKIYVRNWSNDMMWVITKCNFILHCQWVQGHSMTWK